MSKAEPSVISVHEDVDLFREAVRFTAAQTGFVPRLIEKDYFCTVLLAYLSGAAGNELVFKGGTCLTKVHSELYRLSEDLDYTIPVAADTPRSERSKQVEPVKVALSRVNRAAPVFPGDRYFERREQIGAIRSGCRIQFDAQSTTRDDQGRSELART